jgi:hypothetical protein
LVFFKVSLEEELRGDGLEKREGLERRGLEEEWGKNPLHLSKFFHQLMHNWIVLKTILNFLISNFCRVLNIVCVLLGISPASDCDLPTFGNSLSVPSSKAGCRVLSGR